MYPAVIKDTAAADIQKAYDYLEDQEAGLGERFLQSLTDYMSVIESNPYLFRSGYRQVRQVRIKPYQYLLRYKIYSNYVVVIQLFHAKQHPKKKNYR